MDPLHQRWHHCKALLGQRIGPEDSAAWLAGLRLDEVRADRVVLSGIPNAFFRTRILRHFRGLLLSAVDESFPEVRLESEPALELHVGAPARVPAGAPPPSGGAPAAGGGDDPSAGAAGTPGSDTVQPGAPALNGRLTFDTFLAAPCNASALRFAEAVAAAPGGAYNPLLVVGETGLGKTHLLQALAHALRARDPGAPVVYRTGEAFRNEVLEGISRRRMNALRAVYREADALIVDGLDALLVSPRTQDELLHTIDHLHAAGRQLVLSAGRLPRALQGMGDALRSRLEMGLIAELEPPDAETRRALVCARARAEALTLPDGVADLLARRVTRNLRRLEGALVRLKAYAGLHDRPVTLAFAEQVAAPFFDPEPQRGAPVAAETILERVADRFGMTLRTLKGRSRSPHVVHARRLAIHLLKTAGGLSYPEIGACLGNRSHSTIIHGHRTLQDELAQNGPLRTVVQQLEDALATVER